MKLLRGNGRTLEVYDIAPPIYTLEQKPGGPPIKHNAWEIVSDDAARTLLKDLLATKLYLPRGAG